MRAGTRLELPRVSRFRHLSKCAVDHDPLAPTRGITRIEQSIDGHVHELRITVVALTIGEGGIQRLDDQVQRLRGVMAEGSEVVTVQNRQRLWRNRPLAPWTTAIDVVAAIASRNRALNVYMERLQIRKRQESTLFREEPRHALRDVARVEAIARR